MNLLNRLIGEKGSFRRTVAPSILPVGLFWAYITVVAVVTIVDVSSNNPGDSGQNHRAKLENSR